VNDLAGALTRATGIVAAAVSVAALVSGFLFSARETGERRRPAWWLDLHQGLGGLALAAVGVHLVTSLLDSGAGVGLAQALVPWTARAQRLALTLGVVGSYLLAAAVFTTWPRRLTNRRLWHWIHLASTIGVLLALVHGYQMGTDATRLAFRVGLVGLAAPVAYAVTVRSVDAALRAGARAR
jgi:sulfoxide reductase heme-binding subunit YedZ